MQQTRCINCMKEMNADVRICPHCGYDQMTEQPANFLRPGTILRGRYQVGRVIGRGGFGITYVGFDLTLEIKVAIKEYYPSGAATRNSSWSNQVMWDSREQGQDAKKRRADSMEHVLKEARRTAKLSAVSAVVRVTDAFQENDTAYIVMDFIEGITLKEYLTTHGVMTWEECEQMLFPVMEGLAEAHDLGIIHRDISPDNIMIRPDGTAKLLDLGAAVDVSSNNGHASTLVVKNHFSAWEQYYESGQIGSWTDVYAFAAMFYYCLTGKLMMPVMDRMATQSEITFPERPEIPEHVKETLKKALAIRQEDRIQDMREFERELAQEDCGSIAEKHIAVAEEVDYDKTQPWTAEDARAAAGAQSAAVLQSTSDAQSSENAQGASDARAEDGQAADDDGSGNGDDSEDNQKGGIFSLRNRKIAGIAAAACFFVLLIGIAVIVYLNKTPSKIAVAAMPDKVEYCIGESFDEQGLELSVTYLSGKTETISADSDSGITVESAVFTTAGMEEVTISYGGRSTTLAVTVTQNVTNVADGTDSNSRSSGEEETNESADGSSEGETPTDSEDDSEAEETTSEAEDEEDTEQETTSEEESTTTKKTEETTTAQPTTTQVNASISLNKSSVSAYIGDTAQLNATVSPAGASVTWTSSDTSVVTVDSNGNLKALKKGTATVQASITYSGSTKKASCEVTVKSPSVSLDKSSVSVYAGDTAQLTATVTPSGTSVSYTTSDSSVVTVNSSGKLSGVSRGTATVKATITYQGTQYQASCSVTVSLTSTQTAARAAAEKAFAAEDEAEAVEKKANQAAEAAEEAAEKAREAGTGKIQYNETYGVYTFSDGSKYEGHMSNYNRNGYGVYTYSNGDTYAGEWTDGERTGYGVFTFASGATSACEWENGSRVGYGVYDEKDSNGNAFHYAGEWADDTVNGYGVYYFPSGNYYAGQWEDLNRSGYGVWYSSNGTIKSEGLWEADKLQ